MSFLPSFCEQKAKFEFFRGVMEFIGNLTGLLPELIYIIEEYALPSIVEKCYPNMPVECIIPISPSKVASVGNGKIMINDEILVDYNIDAKCPITYCKVLYNKNIAICVGNFIYFWDLRYINSPCKIVRFPRGQKILEILELKCGDILCSTDNTIYRLYDIGNTYTVHNLNFDPILKMKELSDNAICGEQNSGVLIMTINNYRARPTIFPRYMAAKRVALFSHDTYFIEVYSDGIIIYTPRNSEPLGRIIKCDKNFIDGYEREDGSLLLWTLYEVFQLDISYNLTNLTSQLGSIAGAFENNKFLFTYCYDNVLWYDKGTLAFIASISQPRFIIKSFSVDDDTILIIDNEFNISVYALSTSLQYSLPSKIGINSAVVVDNKLIAGVGNDIIAFDVNTHERLYTLRDNVDGTITHMIVEQNYLKTFGRFGNTTSAKLSCWDLRTKKIEYINLIRVINHVDGCFIDGKTIINCNMCIISFSGQHDYVPSYTKNINGIAHNYDIKLLSNERLKIEPIDPGRTITPVSCLVKSKTFLVSGDKSGSVQFWKNLKLVDVKTEHKTGIAHLSTLHGICGTEFTLSQDKTGIVCIWNGTHCIAHVKNYPFEFSSIGDGKYIETYGNEKTGVRIFI